jgi:hypothetical protein
MNKHKRGRYGKTQTFSLFLTDAGERFEDEPHLGKDKCQSGGIVMANLVHNEKGWPNFFGQPDCGEDLLGPVTYCGVT